MQPYKGFLHCAERCAVVAGQQTGSAILMQKLPFPGSGGPFGKAGAKPDQRPAGLVYRFGPFELDVDRYELRRQGLRLRMAPAPMELLMLLIERRNTLIGREAITARLWSDSNMVDVDQGINTAMRRVREVLRDDPSQPRFIETVVGKGYRFVAEVQEGRSGVAFATMPEKLHILQKPEPPELKDIDLKDIERRDISSSPEPEEPSESYEIPAQPGTATQTLRPGGWSIRRGALVAAAAVLLLIIGTAYEVWRLLQPKTIHYAASLTQITANDSEQRVTAAAFSPDGKWITYADLNGLSLRLLQTAKTVPLKAPEAIRIERIAWFSDQTKILVSGFDPVSGASQIWTVYITG